MNRNKTGLIILTLIAGVFFLFIAILFNSSTNRLVAINRIDELNARLDLITEEDITVYWIGEPCKELEHLLPVISVIAPESASEDNLPVKGPSFHTTEYNPNGIVIEENIPKEYPAHMLIVMTGDPVLSDEGREALLNAVSQNGVPVLAIGDKASDVLGELLSYRRVHRGPGSSLYYCLGKGYRENPLPENSVSAGGMELAEAIPDLITAAVADYIPQN